MSFIDHYAILGVSPTADDDEIRQTYRNLARLYHPDVNPSPGAALVLKDINAANEVLSNAQKRAEYDQVFKRNQGYKPSLRMDVKKSRSTVRRMDEPQLLSVLVRVQPLLEANLGSNAAVNLSLVVDRSKSMDGARLQHVKRAANLIIEECVDTDIVSLITFSDRAEVVIPAQHPTDRRAMKALISTIRADGATAMLAGLEQGLNQVERYRDPKYVNHLILITDGRTYGDEDACLKLASNARDRGIGISGMGIGEDWNDNFLDALTSRTGGSSAYVTNAEGVSVFLHDRIKSLATAYAERTELTIASSPYAELKSITRISPDPTELSPGEPKIALGTIDGSASTAISMEFHLRTGKIEDTEFSVARLDLQGEVLGSNQRSERVLEDIRTNVAAEPPEEDPPPELLDALGRLRMYRLQSRARDALEQGEVAEATRQLEYLATRLFETGEDALAQAALHEAQRVKQTAMLSDEGAKRLKYGTRALLPMENGL